MKLLLFSLRNLRREWKSGELRVLVLALLVAITSITSVAFFTDRIERVLQHQAGELIASDMLVYSTQKPPAAWQEQAVQRGLGTALILDFPSVVVAGEHTQLTAIKAVTEGYPLRGRMRVADQPYAEGQTTDSLPDRGEIWLDSRLFSALQLKLGDRVQVGSIDLTATRILTYEPDRGGEFFYIAPRLMMHMQDVPSTELVQPASRVKYRLLMSGTDKALTGMRKWLQPRLREGDEIQGVRDARPELRVALDRARDFLGLAALVAVLLAGVAIAIAAGRYAHRHFDHCAILRCLGASQRFIQGLYFLKLMWLGIAGGLVASGLGYLAQLLLAEILSGIVNAELPPPSLYPVLTGLVTAIVMLLGFALPPLLRLQHTPPLRVLRRELDPLPVSNFVIYSAAAIAMAVLMILQIREAKLTISFYFGSLATLAILAISARLLIYSVGLLKKHSGISWRFGLANLIRRPRGSSTQILGFGIGIMALLFLTLIRNDLLNDWQKTLPTNAPNQFAINIQPDQVQAIQTFFTRHSLPQPKLYPMVRARLSAINDKDVKRENYDNARAQRLATREFNLSWYDEPQELNLVTAGRWFSENSKTAEFSVDEGIAETLGIHLGDTLHYQVAGQKISGRVTSLRYVNWDTFRPNFFVVARPGMLDGFPTNYICSFHLPENNRDFLNELVRAFPNITLIDVDAVMRQVRGIMDRVILAVEVVFVFTLMAGVLILLAAIQSTQDERLHEGAILRTLGASRKQILTGIIAEFTAMGLLAGLIAGITASAVAYVISLQILNLPFQFHPQWWIWSMLGGAVGVGIAGTLGTLKVTRQSPLVVLRG